VDFAIAAASDHQQEPLDQSTAWCLAETSVCELFNKNKGTVHNIEALFDRIDETFHSRSLLQTKDSLHDMSDQLADLKVRLLQTDDTQRQQLEHEYELLEERYFERIQQYNNRYKEL
jgi:TolA-binding protein